MKNEGENENEKKKWGRMKNQVNEGTEILIDIACIWSCRDGNKILVKSNIIEFNHGDQWKIIKPKHD